MGNDLSARKITIFRVLLLGNLENLGNRTTIRFQIIVRKPLCKRLFIREPIGVN